MTEPATTLFVSHGSPTLILEDVPATHFLRGLGSAVARPKAIVAVSAHWMTHDPAVSGAARPRTIHDFHGFPPALYRMRYDAPGAPEVAARVAEALAAAGMSATVDPEQGLDHGAWVLAWPAADIPILQLAVQPERGASPRGGPGAGATGGRGHSGHGQRQRHPQPAGAGARPA